MSDTTLPGVHTGQGELFPLPVVESIRDELGDKAPRFAADHTNAEEALVNRVMAPRWRDAAIINAALRAMGGRGRTYATSKRLAVMTGIPPQPAIHRKDGRGVDRHPERNKVQYALRRAVEADLLRIQRHGNRRVIVRGPLLEANAELATHHARVPQSGTRDVPQSGTPGIPVETNRRARPPSNICKRCSQPLDPADVDDEGRQWPICRDCNFGPRTTPDAVSMTCASCGIAASVLYLDRWCPDCYNAGLAHAMSQHTTTVSDAT